MADQDRGERELEVRRALGIRIRELRLARGLSQDDFAALAGIHRTHPNKLEHGKTDPQLSTLIRVADALGVSIPQLFEIV